MFVVEMQLINIEKKKDLIEVSLIGRLDFINNIEDYLNNTQKGKYVGFQRRAEVYEHRAYRRLGDLFAYRCAASAEGDPVEVALTRADLWLIEMLKETHTEEYKLFLGNGSHNNFRYSLYPKYKSSRKSKPKPRHLLEVKNFLITEWSAEVCNGYEADDALGIHTSDDTFVVSNDKDLRQIPTEFYDPVKKEYTFVDEDAGRYNFYLQLMMGDRSDDVPGFDGVCRAKPPKFIEKMMENMVHCEEDIFDHYEDKRQFLINYNLLHIWRKPLDLQIPKVLIGKGVCEPEEGLSLQSLLSILDSKNPLWECINQGTNGS